MALALAALAGVAAGARPAEPAAGPPGSVTACAQFGAVAIQHHVTVTTRPAACRGLTQTEVNVAVGRALRAATAGIRDKARQRQHIARDTRYLVGLVRAVPPSAPAPPPRSVPASRAALSLAALAAWLVTVALGLSMLARWITRISLRRRGAGRGHRIPVLNGAHLGLAAVSLLAWISYLATGLTGLAWAACGLLLPVAGLGMTLVFLAPARSPTAALAAAAAGPTAMTAPTMARSAGAGGAGRPAPARRPPALLVAAHIAAATLTILLAVLAAIGSG